MTPAGCSIIQFSSDTIYLELASNPRGLRAQSRKTVPTSNASLRSQVVTYTSDSPAYIEVRVRDPLLGFSNLLEWITELKEAFTCVYQFVIKAIIKDLRG